MVHSSELFKFINFADDTTLITNLNNEDMRNISLNYELANCHNYLKANKLSLNVNKTKAMFFHMPQKRIQLPLIKIAGEDIAFVDNFNFLGIIINKHLNWTSHVDMLSAKLSKTMSILNTLKHVLPINIMRTLYTSLILCHLNYGVLLWGPKLRDNDNLHILQKKAVRIITSSSYFAHSEPLFKQLRLLKTCDIYKCVLLKCIFKLTHKQSPHYFEQLTFTFRNQQHNYATRTCQNGSALSPFLFILLVDTISQEVRTELPWELLYADDLAIIDITSTDTQNRLESWQKVLTDNGLKINVAKTEHLSTRENPLPMKVNGDVLKNVDHFNYLGSVIDRDGTIDRDVDLRVRAAWSSWRKLTGVLYDRKIPLRLKAKVYEAIIRPALTYGSECWAMKVNNKRKIATTDMRMLRGILGVTRRDHIRNEEIRRILNISPIDEVMRCGRLRWFGHVQRRDADNVTRRVMNLAIPGTRRRGRPKKTWNQQLKDDMTAVGVTQDVALNRTEWRRRTRPTPTR